jgi:hypothetical protein
MLRNIAVAIVSWHNIGMIRLYRSSLYWLAYSSQPVSAHAHVLNGPGFIAGPSRSMSSPAQAGSLGSV